VTSIVVGTAGHIDHGKSALVRALTGTDPDRLKEEKARGITIDLGFAHQAIDGITFAFVDVPGHERFVKNMLAGVGGIDLTWSCRRADESSDAANASTSTSATADPGGTRRPDEGPRRRRMLGSRASRSTRQSPDRSSTVRRWCPCRRGPGTASTRSERRSSR
jgi:hypothetical protein